MRRRRVREHGATCTLPSAYIKPPIPRCEGVPFFLLEVKKAGQGVGEGGAESQEGRRRDHLACAILFLVEPAGSAPRRRRPRHHLRHPRRLHQVGGRPRHLVNLGLAISCQLGAGVADHIGAEQRPEDKSREQEGGHGIPVHFWECNRLIFAFS